MTKRSSTRFLFRAIFVGAVISMVACGPVAADLIKDGDFEKPENGVELRRDGKGQDWYETRNDTKEGRKLLKLSKKDIGGNATQKAMIKGHKELNTYMSQRFSREQKEELAVRYDIFVKRIYRDDNRSAFCLIGNSTDGKRGPCSTGKERFVFLGFENADTKGKINLFAREAGNKWAEKTIVAENLDLKKWYTIDLNIDIEEKSYTASVVGVTDAVTLKAFETKGHSPKKLTHLSFASWNDGAGTFYIDNVVAR